MRLLIVVILIDIIITIIIIINNNSSVSISATDLVGLKLLNKTGKM
jgi:hypothetical protein